MEQINWEQLLAQVGVVSAGVAAVTFLVRNAMSTHWTKLELAAAQTAELKRRIDVELNRRMDDIDKRNEKGDKIHEDHSDRLTRVEESAKSAHHRLDRAGG
jgi:hypothetical protein